MESSGQKAGDVQLLHADETLDANRDLVISLLRGNSAGMPVSDLWRGFLNRDIDVGYNAFESWLLDQSDLVSTAADGGITLKARANASSIRKTQVIPDEFDHARNLDAGTRFHHLIAYYQMIEYANIDQFQSLRDSLGDKNI